LQKISRGLEKLIKELGLEDAVKENAMKERWGELMGEPLSSHLSPKHLAGRTLHINVDSPLWLQEASFYKNEILKKLAPLGIKDIKLKASGLGGKKSINAKRAKVEKKEPPLTEEERILLENSTRPIKDEVLKEISKNLLIKALRREKKTS